MLKVYGMKICPDTVECCEALTKAGVEYEFLDFAEKTDNLSLLHGKRKTGYSGRTAVLPCPGTNGCKYIRTGAMRPCAVLMFT